MRIKHLWIKRHLQSVYVFYVILSFGRAGTIIIFILHMRLLGFSGAFHPDLLTQCQWAFYREGKRKSSPISLKLAGAKASNRTAGIQKQAWGEIKYENTSRRKITIKHNKITKRHVKAGVETSVWMRNNRFGFIHCQLMALKFSFLSLGLVFFPLHLPLSDPKGKCRGCEGDKKSSCII